VRAFLHPRTCWRSPHATCSGHPSRSGPDSTLAAPSPVSRPNFSTSDNRAAPVRKNCYNCYCLHSQITMLNIPCRLLSQLGSPGPNILHTMAQQFYWAPEHERDGGSKVNISGNWACIQLSGVNTIASISCQLSSL